MQLYASRLRDLQLKQNLAPIRNTLSKAMSGGAKAVSSGRSKLMKGVDAFWNEFERGAASTNEEGGSSSSARETTANDNNHTPSYPISRNSTSSHHSENSAPQLSPLLETTTQQAGRLFSNFSSFLSRKSKEFTQAMEVRYIYSVWRRDPFN